MKKINLIIGALLMLSTLFIGSAVAVGPKPVPVVVRICGIQDKAGNWNGVTTTKKNAGAWELTLQAQGCFAEDLRSYDLNDGFVFLFGFKVLIGEGVHQKINQRKGNIMTLKEFLAQATTMIDGLKVRSESEFDVALTNGFRPVEELDKRTFRKGYGFPPMMILEEQSFDNFMDSQIERAEGQEAVHYAALFDFMTANLIERIVYVTPDTGQNGPNPYRLFAVGLLADGQIAGFESKIVNT